MSSFASQPQSAAAQEPSGFFSIERVVALLTPVFAAAAGWVSTEIAKLIPGLGIPRDQLVAVFVGGATIAAGSALKWLHGRQKFVNFTTNSDQVVDKVVAEVQKTVAANSNLSGAVSQIESALNAHQSAIEQALSSHLPAGAQEVAQEIVRQLWPTAQTPPHVSGGSGAVGGTPQVQPSGTAQAS
jgi:hypothetical protein